MLFVHQLSHGQPRFSSTGILAITAAAGLDSNVNPYISYMLVMTRTNQVQMDWTKCAALLESLTEQLEIINRAGAYP